jgi:hypothetical protein
MRVPLIQLSNGAEKITTLASNGNLYMTGWEKPGNMGGISLFQGVYSNGVEPNLSPGLNGTVTIDITNIPNFTATTSNAFTTTNTISPSNNYTSLTNPIYYNGNYVIASTTIQSPSGNQIANGVYVSSTGLSWTRIANVPLESANAVGAIYLMSTNGSNVVMADTDSAYISSGNLTSWANTGTNPLAGSHVLNTENIIYSNNVFLITYQYDTGNFNYAIGGSASSDGGNNWSTASLIKNGASSIFNFVTVSNNNFVVAAYGGNAAAGGGANNKVIAYSSDGISWNYNNVPNYYANSDTTNGFPYINQLWAGNSTLGAIVIDRNGSNTSQTIIRKAISSDLGNSWSSANMTANDTAALYNSNVFVGKNIIQYQSGYTAGDDRLLSLHKSNSNANSTTIVVYTSNNSVDFTFAGNLTVANSVRTDSSLWTGVNGKLIISNNFWYTNVVSNIQHAVANIPAIATFYSNGSYNSVVQDSTYQSLGGTQNANTTLFIKTQ